MALATLPVTSRTSTQPNRFSDCYANDAALADQVNGNLDATNLASNAVTTAKILDGAVTNAKIAASAGIPDSKLASPNNSAYKTLLTVQGWMISTGAAPKFFLGDGTMIPTPNVATPQLPILYLDDADYTVAGLSPKLRVRAQCFTPASGSSNTSTVGLYPITGISAGAYTIGAVTSGSTVAFSPSAANTASQSNSGDFAFPTDGYYILGIATTPSSAIGFTAQLQTRNV